MPRATKNVTFGVRPEEKARFVRGSRDHATFSVWARSVLNEAAGLFSIEEDPTTNPNPKAQKARSNGKRPLLTVCCRENELEAWKKAAEEAFDDDWGVPIRGNLSQWIRLQLKKATEPTANEILGTAPPKQRMNPQMRQALKTAKIVDKWTEFHQKRRKVV